MFVLLALTSLVTSCGARSSDSSKQDGVSGGEGNNQTPANPSGDNGSSNHVDTVAVTLDPIDFVKVFAKKSEYKNVYA